MGTVKIELRGPLARYGTRDKGTGRMEMTADNGVTVLEILNQLHIPCHHVGLIVVNGKKGTMQTALREGDHLIIFPVVAGG
ncbi:MoaD/ThiS family protein [Desulfallas sp. Bu1-1]|uniref:MoaD/ThiS family protein n=1 Tax=Desulfallas sp. Bu1-1 TaxID=2787620 RepID=UPI00189E87D0|nr:MoaD/ThiS family protein [Desulfallas sp. Bu1-1]MBF7081537.1 MoaD/ThiS family protein [Desulfallas sp. Bu1-1]